jgi:hypothetical protein
LDAKRLVNYMKTERELARLARKEKSAEQRRTGTAHKTAGHPRKAARTKPSLTDDD